MVRITIDVEGDQVGSTTSEAQAQDANIPADLQRAAAAIGARNAGPAPKGPGREVDAGDLAPEEVAALGGPAVDAGPGPVETTGAQGAFPDAGV